MRHRRFGLLLAAGLLAALPAQAAAPEESSRAQALGADLPRVLIETSKGDIEVELYPDEAPATVDNFLRLVDKGFYDGLIFHRVIPGFMIQTGGYDEGMNHEEPPGTVKNESSNGLENRTGTLAMARLSDPDSASAQFFINVVDNNHLNAHPGQPGYTVFGRVVEGMDVVHDIEEVETTRKAGMPDVPKTPVVIEDVQRLQ